MTVSRVLYILKRYPRLSETFIVNEIRALERLYVGIDIVSLLPPETGLRHEAVANVFARVTTFPEGVAERTWTTISAHARGLAAAPARYATAARAAIAWAIETRSPASVAKHFWRAGFIADLARRRELPRIHAHFAHGPTSTAHLVSLMTGIPFSFTAHAKDLYLSRPESIARRTAAATAVVTCTKYNVDYIRGIASSADAAKVSCVYHGIDLRPFLDAGNARERGDGPQRILTVGRLVEKKGYSDLVRACKLLAERGVDFAWTIVGTGPLAEQLAGQVDDAGIRARTVFAGAMAHDRLLRYYSEADVFALAPVIADDGDRDGIPNVLVEAAAARVPIVTTSVSGIPELVEHGRTGLLVEPNAPQALADALQATLADPAAARARAETALAFVRSRFDVFRNAEALARLFGAPRTETTLTVHVGSAP